MSATIFEVLEFGPIVAGDEDMGYLVTINGAYLNLWSSQLKEHSQWRAEVIWNNIDCRPTTSINGIYSLTAAEAWDLGKEWLAEILADLNTEDDESEDES